MYGKTQQEIKEKMREIQALIDTVERVKKHRRLSVAIVKQFASEAQISSLIKAPRGPSSTGDDTSSDDGGEELIDAVLNDWIYGGEVPVEEEGGFEKVEKRKKHKKQKKKTKETSNSFEILLGIDDENFDNDREDEASGRPDRKLVPEGLQAVENEASKEEEERVVEDKEDEEEERNIEEEEIMVTRVLGEYFFSVALLSLFSRVL